MSVQVDRKPRKGDDKAYEERQAAYMGSVGIVDEVVDNAV